MNINTTIDSMQHRMHKKAVNWSIGLPMGGAVVNSIGNIGAMSAAFLIATAVTMGTGLGYVTAKVMAKGKQDEDTAKKGYENERLKADIGYLSGKLRQERSQLARQTDPKAARILG